MTSSSNTPRKNTVTVARSSSSYNQVPIYGGQQLHTPRRPSPPQPTGGKRAILIILVAILLAFGIVWLIDRGSEAYIISTSQDDVPITSVIEPESVPTPRPTPTPIPGYFSRFSDVQQGEVITFRNLQWRVLRVSDTYALVISEDIIDSVTFHRSRTNVTWLESDLRSYLNNTFYYTFTVQQRSRFLMNHDDDKIFILSCFDVTNQFRHDADRRASCDCGAVRRWWLRCTQGNQAKIVHDDGSIQTFFGNYRYANVNSSGVGYRPALFINLLP